MLYYLFSWLHLQRYPGTGVFQYISFRSVSAFVLALIISIFFGKYFIKFLKKKQIGESIRDLGLEGQNEKAGTPTMGGLIIIAAILIPVLLLCELRNIYVLLMIFTTIWLGLLGFADDYTKVFKKNKEGLSPRKKLLGQILLGLVVGSVMYFHPGAVICEKTVHRQQTTQATSGELLQVENQENVHTPKLFDEPHHSSKTTIPFVKNHELDYSALTRWMGDKTGKWSFLFFIPIIVFIIAAVSNGANLTDGLDGLCAGSSILVFVLLAISCVYLFVNKTVSVFSATFVGALAGFLVFNYHPAKIFMGDTGSLAIGGALGAAALMCGHPFLLFFGGLLFVFEALSVLLQVGYFKISHGKRIFKMAPLHHHFEKCGWKELTVTYTFWAFVAVCCIVTYVLARGFAR